MSDIQWRNVTVRLGDITPWEHNPKSISKRHAKRLLDYWQRIGQFQTIAIGPGGELYDGHQRVAVLLAAYGPNYQVDARQSSRPLTDDERREMVIAAHVGTVGQFDWDELSGWDDEALRGWGLDDEALRDWRRDASALRLMQDELDAREAGNPKYSWNIESPVYQPHGEKPAISELYDDAKTQRLIAEIEASDIPDDEKKFLIAAAYRHTVIRYDKVAEYYAHASAEMQRLMEHQVLVIIDFDSAIERGYAKISDKIVSQFLEENDDEG